MRSVDQAFCYTLYLLTLNLWKKNNNICLFCGKRSVDKESSLSVQGQSLLHTLPCTFILSYTKFLSLRKYAESLMGQFNADLARKVLKMTEIKEGK